MTKGFAGTNRKQLLINMAAQEVDLLVVGGGITGCGIALDAAARGMKTALVEMQDFAAGTSSRSTKLVHGGLRYLKQFEVKMVAEVGKERAIVYENGPHVTTPEWMLLPMHEGGTFGKFSTSIGLRVYDYLAGVKREERRHMLTPEETLAKEPLVKQDGLKGGGYYVEYRTDDARLTIEVLKEAVAHGAQAVNYAKVIELLYKDGKVVGATVQDRMSGACYNIYAKKVVNATGPWVDELREKDGSKKGKNLRLTKGVHLVVDGAKFPLKQAVYFDTPDGRMVFAIPRDGKTYVGTTDTFFDKDTAHPKMTAEDRAYIVNAVNYMFPSVKLAEEDVESSWAGVRPLIYEEGKDPSEISRKDEIWQSASGLITIAGGKLTGYRKMAEMVVDLVVSLLAGEGLHFGASMTKNMPISGGHVGGSAGFPEFMMFKESGAAAAGLSAGEYARLVRLYGSNIDRLFDIASGYQAGRAYGLPRDVYAQAVYAVQEEMAAQLTDFFIRRTGALFFNIQWVHQWKAAVADYMADALGWSPAEKEYALQELEQELHDAVQPVPVG